MKEIEFNQTDNVKITFLRHAQSLSNKAVHDFRDERQLPDCWKTFTSIDDFNQKVIYNPDLCDCGISDKGLKQCKQAKQKLNDKQFDLILVSPLERALETCRQIFGDRFDQVKVISQPLLAESLKYSSDISGQISGKAQRFPNYNFQNVEKQGNFWFLKNDDIENQKLYFEYLDNYVHLSHQQKQKQIAKLMYMKNLRQSNLNIRKRVQKLKQLIRQYAKTYKNIAVVSHYYTIKHILAKKISATGEPLEAFHGANCSIHEAYVKDL